MKFNSGDKIKESTTTTGTGDITLNGAVTAHQTMASGVDWGIETQYCPYMIANANETEFEIGYGELINTLLKRIKVLKSSNGNNLVNFSSGTKYVTCPIIPDYVLLKNNFPAWDSTPNFVNFIKAYNSHCIPNYPESYESITNSAGYSFAQCLAPNGCLYGFPYNSNIICKLNTTNDTVSSISTVSNYGYLGCALARNGCIYTAPFNSSIMKFNPSNDTFTIINVSPAPYLSWYGAVMAENGHIYCSPYDATSVLKINTSNDTYSTFGTVNSADRWTGCCLAPDGMIYCASDTSSGILKINPINDTLSIITPAGGGPLNNLRQALIQPDGDIFMSGVGGEPDFIVNTQSEGVFSVSVPSGTFLGGALGLNKKIYCMPDGSGKIKVRNLTAAKTYSFGGSAYSDPNSTDSLTFTYRNATLCPNGYMYSFSTNSNRLLKIKTIPGPVDINFCLSPYINKT